MSMTVDSVEITCGWDAHFGRAKIVLEVRTTSILLSHIAWRQSNFCRHDWLLLSMFMVNLCDGALTTERMGTHVQTMIEAPLFTPPLLRRENIISNKTMRAKLHCLQIWGMSVLRCSFQCRPHTRHMICLVMCCTEYSYLSCTSRSFTFIELWDARVQTHLYRPPM